MQKVLLASTALAFSAGWAMADVTNVGADDGASISLEGYAAMGIIGNDDDVSFASDLDLVIDMVGQTDGGLEFGASIELDDAIEGGSGAFDPDTQGGETIYVQGAFGRVSIGDTDGALDWAMSEASFGGSIGDIEEHAGWNGNSGLDGLYDGQVARYEYSFGDFGVAVSGEISDENDGDPVLGIGGKYSMMYGGTEMTFGAGVQTVSGLDDVVDTALDDDDDFAATVWGLSADVRLASGIMAIVNYSTANVDGFEGDDDSEHYGLAIGYETGPLLVAANYGHFEDWIARDGDDDLITEDSEGYGLLANYDLGGGAALQGAYSRNIVDGDDFDTYSFGVAMSF